MTEHELNRHPSKLIPAEPAAAGAHCGARRGVSVALTVAFLAVISSVAIVQTSVELYRGERVQACEVFTRTPTTRHLREFETELQAASVVARALRPWMQYANYRLLGDAGEKAVIGRDGWLFYRPSVEYLASRVPSATADQADDPIRAIVAFRDALRARGIHLLVLPAPNKESIYPERLSRRGEALDIALSRETRGLMERMKASGVDVIDLFALYRQAKREAPASGLPPLYLAQDSHWTPYGLELAAKATARHLVESGRVQLGNALYEARPAPVTRLGDLVTMLQVPQIERSTAPEEIACMQVVDTATGRPYRDARDAEVLVIGDSFLRIYEHDEPRSAGFVAHLARELRQPLSSIVSDGGASTVVRQELARRAARVLPGKKVVVWEFVERDIRFGTDGWQIVPLGPRDLPDEPTCAARTAEESGRSARSFE